MARHRKAPYPGPTWTGAPICGRVTPGVNGSATQGPNVDCDILWISLAGSGTVSINNIGTASVGVGGLPVLSTPQYVPCQNLNQLYFVADATTSFVNYFGW